MRRGPVINCRLFIPDRTNVNELKNGRIVVTMSMTDIVCTICLEPTKVKKHVSFLRPKHSNDVILKCQHVYHRACIKKWLVTGANGMNCPCCRDHIKMKESCTYMYLIFLYPFKKLVHNCMHEYDLADKYIYYDNAAIILFIIYIYINIRHHCFLFVKAKNTIFI